LASIYRRLPSSAGLPFGATAASQRVALLDYYRRLDHYVGSCDYRPRISIVVPTYRPDYGYLREMLGSIALQTYPDWQLCIVDDASGDPALTRILTEFADAHPGKVAFATRTTNGHIAAASNDALALADGDYVALLDHDDRLYPHALAEVVRGVNTHRLPDGRYPLIVYTDERMIDEHGAPIGEVWLKPDWMPLLHLTSNYTNHLTVYAREMLVGLGGFRSGFDGSQDHDLMLRATEVSEAEGVPIVHVPTIAYQWRSHPGSVAKDPQVKSYSIEPAMRAVAEACQRRGRPARVWREEGIVANRIDFTLPVPRPSVRVALLPSGGDPVRCERALRTGDYPDLDVVRLDRGRPPAAALDEALDRAAADGVEYLAVVADVLESERPDWVAAMVSLAQLPEVGVVGGLVLRGDGRVASAGLVGLGPAGTAPAMAGMPPTEEVYLAWPASIHEVLAVPPDLMMVDVAAAHAVGGFCADDSFAYVHYATDLCLRLRQAGLRTVFTPYAEFTERAVRDARTIDLAERSALVRTWSQWLSSDPYVNPGLAHSGQFRVDPEVTLPEVPAELFDAWLAAGQVY
jgi:GT2 family glycosyltransferase